jgi:ParB family chromosome partitioning protein
MKRKALGKGLRSLIPEAPARSPRKEPGSPGENLLRIDIDKILPNRSQPREQFDQETLDQLASSLKSQGVLQPVIVRPVGDGEYELIAGERRWRAAQIAGLLKIPAIVREVAEESLLELALIENLQREGLNPLEEAAAYQTLIDKLRLTQQEVADRVGKKRATVANSLRLLNLPPEVQEEIRAGRLPAGHARALLALANATAQTELARRVVRESLSVRTIEKLVARAADATGTKRTSTGTAERDPNVLAAEEELQRSLGTKVRIVTAKKGGRIELHFFSDEELERVYQLLLHSSRPTV